MDKCFENILKFTLGYEKYKSNDPNDSGGLTIWGFASKYHPKLVDELNKMSPEDAKIKASEEYFKQYWLEGRCDKLPVLTSQAHFDACVNPGKGAAVRFVQKIVGTVEDGSFGPGTKKAVDIYLANNSDEVFANKIINLRQEYYNSRNNPFFIKGWTNRIKDLKKYLKLS